MLPGGKLYVPGAEKIIPNIRRLIDAARAAHILIVSSRCAHSENDPEFATFPPHCIRGTAGAEIVPGGMLPSSRVLPNDGSATLPDDIFSSPQIVIEKQALDVFTNPRTGELVARLGAESRFVVFGVVTEYCVQFAAGGLLERGRSVSVVRDAVETLDTTKGARTLSELESRGAHIVSTDEVTRQLQTGSPARA